MTRKITTVAIYCGANARGENSETRTEAYIDGIWYTIARNRMTYNAEGKRTSLENLAGQVTTTAWDGWSVTYNGEDFEAEDSSCYDVELLSYDTIESFLQDEAEAYFDKVLKEWHDANNAYQKEEETKGRHKEIEKIKTEYDKKRKGK